MYEIFQHTCRSNPPVAPTVGYRRRWLHLVCYYCNFIPAPVNTNWQVIVHYMNKNRYISVFLLSVIQNKPGTDCVIDIYNKHQKCTETIKCTLLCQYRFNQYNLPMSISQLHWAKMMWSAPFLAKPWNILQKLIFRLLLFLSITIEMNTIWSFASLCFLPSLWYCVLEYTAIFTD